MLEPLAAEQVRRPTGERRGAMGPGRVVLAVLVVLALVLGAACSGAPDQLTTTPATSRTTVAPAATDPPGTATTIETTTTTVETTTTTTTPPPTTPAPPSTVRTTAPRAGPPPTWSAVTAPPPTAAAAVLPPPLPPGASSVFVEGDSVLLGTTETLPAALYGWIVTMDTVGSRRLAQAIPILQQRRGEIGRVVVIQLGNNYIPGEGGSYGSQIDQTMAVLDGVDRVVWLTISEALGPTRVEINHEIRAAASRWSNLVVAEWAPMVAEHPEYAPGDGLHLTQSGRLAISDLIARHVGPAPG